jgi:hypothetical protein
VPGEVSGKANAPPVMLSNYQAFLAEALVLPSIFFLITLFKINTSKQKINLNLF